MAIAEVFLGAFLAVLFERLASRELLSFARSVGIHTQVIKLRKVLMTIKAVLNDAETKQISDETVNMWLEDLRVLAYDVDDLVDEIATEASAHQLKSETEAAAAATSKVKVLNFLPPSFTDFPRSVELKFKFGPKIEEITSRLQEMAQLRDDLGLREVESSTRRERLPTTSLVVESHVYGREKEKQDILELVLKDEACNDEARVIPIVGMGGVGKTTLAQLVYNDDKVKDFFDTKAWVCVSEEFDVFMITKIIHEAVTKERHDFNDLNMLQVSLKEKLSGLKFLIVLDDVWNENYEKWDLLRAPFRVGLPGSKIIVTTRHERVACIMGSVPAYPLNVLAEESCLPLLAQHALDKTNFDDHPNLEAIGKEIVKKCGFLPLAMKTLGGLLHNIHSPNEWKTILNSKIWELSEHQSGILPALRLSYHHLPSHLKQMFTYCAIFPKDYVFDKDELVLLWMAEGFLQQPTVMKTMEELGGIYFDELLSRSFFQCSGGTKSNFVMHDLLNDLAQFVAGEICFRLDNNMESNEHCKISQKARHSSFIRRRYEVLKRFKEFHELERLRTFLPLPLRKVIGFECYLNNSVLVNLLPKLRCLRVLSLSGYEISELPNSIGDLKHLRYLNLSETLIKWLPESVSNLYNLQTLSLKGCRALCKLPANIGNLVNLRHLDIRDTPKLEEMPSGIGRLKCLQTLPKILVGKKSGFRLGELDSLLLSNGMLSIAGLENVMDVKDAEEANLSCKQDINELEFKWNSDIEDSQNDGLQVSVLEMLRPHRELKSLKIEFYRGITFPNWIGDPSFSKIVYIILQGCTKCKFLPPLGQLPLLEVLSIDAMHAVKSVGAEFYCGGSTLEIPFPSLKMLRFQGMPEWEEWSFSYGVDFRGIFPNLHELTIRKCSKLVSVPLLRLLSLRLLKIQYCDEAVLKIFTELPSLTTLKIENVSGLTHLPMEFMNVLVSLKVLKIEKCAALVTLWQNEIAPENLSHLHVESCKNLERLAYDLKSLKFLNKVYIFDCPKLSVQSSDYLESIPNYIPRLEHLSLSNCSSLSSFPIDSPLSTLKSVSIKYCENLKWVKETVERSIMSGNFGISNWPNLRSLIVLIQEFGCSMNYYKINRSLSGNGLLTPNLRSLDISGFQNPFPSQSQSLVFLQSLTIRNCRSLESFPDQNLPPSLKSLVIDNCWELKPLSEWGLQRLSSLRRFTMRYVYPELLSFPDSCFLPSTLQYLCIDEFFNLKSLSNGLRNLTSLRQLEIYHCRKIESLSEELRNLTSLEHLEIINCPKIESLSEGFQSLTSLRSLKIEHCPKIESLSEGLQTLTSLWVLNINKCPKLKSLSEGFQKLTSLRNLKIVDCPELGSLPNKRILDTLLILDIRRCPLLEGRYSKEKGVDWPQIAHIPDVQILSRRW
ncbi:unnamed protein product [Ilex paraguariensis]|uniref:Disease resistance RPP13-like protein 1 n=1 Tax=Ilex paraguariensis TaxID=185542 RepID=A0ABC8QUS0_9AQUA